MAPADFRRPGRSRNRRLTVERVGCLRSIELARPNLTRKPPRPPMTAMGRRFPPPWSTEELTEAFVVRDLTGRIWDTFISRMNRRGKDR
jgi:hypothetical protein